VPEQTKLVTVVEERLTSFLSSREEAMAAISPDLGHLADYAHNLLGNGKRFRARFCYWGWRAAQTSFDAIDLVAGSKPSQT